MNWLKIFGLCIWWDCATAWAETAGILFIPALLAIPQGGKGRFYAIWPLVYFYSLLVNIFQGTCKGDQLEAGENDKSPVAKINVINDLSLDSEPFLVLC